MLRCGRFSFGVEIVENIQTVVPYNGVTIKKKKCTYII